MIRVFLSNWSFIPDPDGYGGEVVPKIRPSIDAVPDAPEGTAREDRCRARFIYGPADANGLPSHPTVLCIVSFSPSVVAKETVEGWDDPDNGVDLLTPYELKMLVKDIPTDVVDKIRSTVVDKYKIDYEAIKGSSSVGELLDRITNHITPHERPITQRFSGKSHEFSK